MDINIRKANINDLKEIQNLNNLLFELEYNNYDNTLKLVWPLEKEGEEYFKDVIENNIAYVAETNGKIIGYLAGSISEQISYITETFAELDNMYVNEEYRRYSVGTLLINEFKKYCKDNSIENIKVTASAKNSKAIQFYMKNGFEDYNVTLKLKV